MAESSNLLGSSAEGSQLHFRASARHQAMALCLPPTLTGISIRKTSSRFVPSVRRSPCSAIPMRCCSSLARDALRSERTNESRANACVRNAIGMRELRVKHILLLRAYFLRSDSRAHHFVNQKAVRVNGRLPSSVVTRWRDQRADMAGTERCSAPLYSESGRISRLSALCSKTCAAQPVMRLHTKTGVNIGMSKPIRK